MTQKGNEAVLVVDTVAVDTQSGVIVDEADDAAVCRQDEDSDAGVMTTESADTPSAGVADPDDADEVAKAKGRVSIPRILAYGVLPSLAVLLAGAAGYVKWYGSSVRAVQVGSVESVAAAKDGAIAILSYRPDSAETDLHAAQDRLTGTFKEAYTQLTNDMVIPAAKQRHISAVATVPAAASVSATGSHAVSLVFVNLTTIVGTDAPTATTSSVRVTLDRVGDRWLISGFDPI